MWGLSRTIEIYSIIRYALLTFVRLSHLSAGISFLLRQSDLVIALYEGVVLKNQAEARMHAECTGISSVQTQ